MKKLFASLLSCLMISLFLSCSMEPEQNFVENEKETFESLKMKVEAMAQEYGVGVSINESVWRKRLPSIDDIEKDFIRIKELSAATRSNMDSTSVNQSYTSVFSNANTNISALENKPRVLKTSTEYLPDRGYYSQDITVNSTKFNDPIYEIAASVSWCFGGVKTSSYVSFDAIVAMRNNDISSPNFGSIVPNTISEIEYPTYEFTGSRIMYRGKSFSGSCVIHFYNSINHGISPDKVFSYNTWYNNENGVGLISIR